MKKKVQTNTIEKITKKRIEEIALDFIVNDKTRADLQRDYNLSKYLVDTLVRDMNLMEKREKYKEQILEKSLERCSTYQSKIIYKATEILNGHIEKIAAQQKREGARLLQSSEIRDVMAILQIVSKENRLDNDKPTDRTIKEVQVQFPEGFTPITQNTKVVDAEYKEVPQEEPEVVEQHEEEIVVEIDDDVLENPLG